MLHQVLKIHPKDNVLVALTDLKGGGSVHFQGNHITLTHDVQAEHKFAEADLAPEQEIHVWHHCRKSPTTPIRKR